MIKIARNAFFALFAVATVAASPALAEEKPKDAKDAAAPAVILSTVGIPIFSADRQVLNYLFVSIRIDLTMGANEAKIHDMEPYFRDAIVRVAHKVSYAQAAHDDTIDEPRFTAALLPEFVKITGPGQIKDLAVISAMPEHHDRPVPSAVQ